MALATADIAEFFDEDMPGYALASIGGADVPGLLRNDYQDVLGIVSGSNVSFLCATFIVTAVDVGDSVVIGSGNYTVASVQPEGAGMTRLLLK